MRERFNVGDKIICIQENYMFTKGEVFTVVENDGPGSYQILSESSGRKRHLQHSIDAFELAASEDEQFLNAL